MSRLIDADNLLKRFEFEKDDTDIARMWKSLFRSVIYDEPTAYDSGEVLKALEVLKASGCENGCPEGVKCSYDTCSECYAAKAIEIVKAGGFDGD